MVGDDNSRAKPDARIPELDLLRFVAALMVVLFHYTFRGAASDALSDLAFPEWAGVSKYGFLGVELFFMISGFVILMTAASGSLRKFFISRVVRLYPAYWLCCTITFVAILTIGRDRFHATFVQYLLNLTMLHEFRYVPSIDGAYWSLRVEIGFYLLVGALLLVRQIRFAELYLALWLAAAAALTWFPEGRLELLLTTRYAPFFAVGAVCYLALARGWSPFRAGLLLLAWAMSLQGALASASGAGRDYATVYDPLAVAGLVSAFVAIMVAVSTRSLPGWVLRDWRVLGALTYPLYLLHQNLGYMIFNALGGSVDRHLLLAGTLTLMLLAAHAVHVWCERPASVRMKPWLERHLWGR